MAWKKYLVTKTGAPGTATAGSIVEAEESTHGDAVCRLIVGERHRMGSDGGLFYVKFKYLQEIIDSADIQDHNTQDCPA